MNILVPDSWLREYLKTKATPAQLKECVSLCGPSIERVHKNGEDVVYDIEVTTNRPDSMSVVGVAREAATILPRFGISAKLENDPYTFNTKSFAAKYKKDGEKKLLIKTDTKLNPRWTSIVLTNVSVGPSPAWLSEYLEKTGIRAINNVIDVTNYLMRAYGQPAHAFDYDEIHGKAGVPSMTLRASRKGEKIITLDGKAHILPGDDIVIEDGDERLVDLCGIMGAQNSSIKSTTTTVILFMQTYNPTNIRRTSMALAHRTEAASLFEKGLDSELVLPTIMKGVNLMEELAHAKVASRLYDLYPAPYKPYNVTTSKEKVSQYIGKTLPDREIDKILLALGFLTHTTARDITVTVPSFRQDVTLDVDIIEEIARIYGYHEIETKLPETEPPIVLPNPTLTVESQIKMRLRDWGYTETYTYSMISKKLMDVFSLNTATAYTIDNPLSAEWIYMRPTLLPSMLSVVEQNLHIHDALSLFELSMVYTWQDHDLPHETPTLTVAVTGEQFRKLKGLAETLFYIMGVPFPKESLPSDSKHFESGKSLAIGEYGTIGVIKRGILSSMNIKQPVTILELDVEKLAAKANPAPAYTPISKFPPVVEDLSVTVQPGFQVGPLLEALKRAHPKISSVTLLSVYENKRTFRIHYSDPTKTLTNFDVEPIRQKLIEMAEEKFDVTVATA